MSAVYCQYASPLGGITLSADEQGITGLWFDGQRNFGSTLSGAQEGSNPHIEDALRWLDIYFSGRKPEFTPALSLYGTPFQLLIWEELEKIPYGSTVTYGSLALTAAMRLGRERMSAQAVGGAVGRNPILLIVPCHRVIGADGSLTGYAAGTDIKRELLRLEGAALGAVDISYP
ncbi:MAG: methylated-DNA--[Ruminococcus sp.]|nr:methylated-DNA--[protein]-cysteine S-methyltransferase [Ruminococcus sp.]